MGVKISESEYLDISTSIDGYINEATSIENFILTDLVSESQCLGKAWEGKAYDKYIKKLDEIYNEISNSCNSLLNLGESMSQTASDIYQKSK